MSLVDEFDDLEALNAQIGANASRATVIPRGPTAEVELWVEDDEWVEAMIRPRPWIVPGYLMRGAVTVIAGPGSAGKSSLTCAWSVALAIGEPLGAFVPHGAARVLTYNVEDDSDEQRRRLSAALRRVERTPAALRGKVLRCGPRGVGTLLDRDIAGALVITAAWEKLERIIKDRAPDVLILDPLVELHTMEENDNTALRLVMAHIRGLAQRYQIAVLLVHHTRKGATAGDVDSIRGAGSLIGAARAAFTVSPMAENEAEELGIGEAQRRAYVRVDSVKANYAPAKAADWHELLEYTLDNGEQIAAIVPWKCPTSTGEEAPERIAMIEAELERGTAGGPYSPRLAADQPRSAAAVFLKHGIATATAQKSVLKQLLGRGWQVQRFRDLDSDWRTGLRSPEGLPQAKWMDGGPA